MKLAPNSRRDALQKRKVASRRFASHLENLLTRARSGQQESLATAPHLGRRGRQLQKSKTECPFRAWRPVDLSCTASLDFNVLPQ